MVEEPVSPEGEETANAPVVVETAEVSNLEPLEFEVRFAEEMANRTALHLPAKHEVLAVSADKLRLSLRDFQDRLKARASWHAPAGILASLLTALVASDFKKFLFPAETWQALFLFASALAAYALIRAAIRAIRASTDEEEIEDLVRQLKE